MKRLLSQNQRREPWKWAFPTARTAWIALLIVPICAVPAGAQSDPYLGPFAPKADCTITGTVKAESGSAIAGATMTLETSGMGGAPALTAKTDASGVYRLNAPRGAYSLEVSAAGYIGGSTTVTLFPGVTNAGGCNEVLTATLKTKPPPTPQPKPNPAFVAYESAVNRYCKTATRFACSLYTADAIQCLAPAESADVIFQSVAMFKKQGLSTQRAVEQVSTSQDSAIIALAAGKMIDDHDHYDKTSFEMAVMRICLAGVSK